MPELVAALPSLRWRTILTSLRKAQFWGPLFFVWPGIQMGKLARDNPGPNQGAAAAQTEINPGLTLSNGSALIHPGSLRSPRQPPK